LNLPRKDEDGKSYLSNSQITLWKRSRADYRKQYIEGERFEGNKFTEFGEKVGGALEKNDFRAFSKTEQRILGAAVRLDVFEREIKIKYDGFYVKGFIDTMASDFSRIIDYKTGGVGKDVKYTGADYIQLCVYALGLRQETGITPKIGQVQFIAREGNPWRGEALAVAPIDILSIDIDISYTRLKAVYHYIFKIAKEIEKYYQEVGK